MIEDYEVISKLKTCDSGESSGTREARIKIHTRRCQAEIHTRRRQADGLGFAAFGRSMM